MSETNSTQRIVLITGASSGIGAALSRRLAAPDTALVLHARGVERRSREALARVAEQARQAGARVETVSADLCGQGAGEEIIRQTLERFGALDQLVSNAGFADRRLFGDVGIEDYRESQRVMGEAFFELASAALPTLKKSSWGRIVAVSSFVAHVFRNDALFAVSAAAKASVEAMVKALAAQLAADGVTVNAVAPGFTKKDPGAHHARASSASAALAPRIPLGRLSEPDEQAATIAFLLSRDAAYITGQVIHVDGGLSLG